MTFIFGLLVKIINCLNMYFEVGNFHKCSLVKKLLGFALASTCTIYVYECCDFQFGRDFP